MAYFCVFVVQIEQRYTLFFATSLSEAPKNNKNGE